MKSKVRIRLKRGINEPKRARRVSNMINSGNQQKLKIKDVKSKE
jgi:hypothetical protein